MKQGANDKCKVIWNAFYNMIFLHIKKLYFLSDYYLKKLYFANLKALKEEKNVYKT